MRVAVILGIAIAMVAGIQGYTSKPSPAVQLQDGTVYFVQPPRLVEAVTTYKEVYVWGATYYFTLNLPENAGEPLQRVTINQREGLDYVRFDLKDTSAFEGTSSYEGQKLGLKDATSDGKTQTTTLVFDPPVPPGRNITIASNPAKILSFRRLFIWCDSLPSLARNPTGNFLVLDD